MTQKRVESFEIFRGNGRRGHTSQRRTSHDASRNRHVRPSGGLLLRHRRLRRLVRRLHKQVQDPAVRFGVTGVAGHWSSESCRQPVQSEPQQAEGVDDQRPRLGLAG